MISIIPRISLGDILEIIIIAFLTYLVLGWIQNIRARQLLRGILVILLFTLFCTFMHFDTILWILGKVATIAVTALIVIFQPELRKALEELGSAPFNLSFIGSDDRKDTLDDKTINEIARAAFEMSKVKTGALMVIERDDSLKDIERTGIAIDGLVTSQLLINIFEHNTPLHDGAVLIRGKHIAAATCYLPLSDNTTISKSLGTRHRAAIGISEISDSVTVVVSEETGGVSVAENGTLTRIPDASALKSRLTELKKQEEPQKRFRLPKGWSLHERKTDR